MGTEGGALGHRLEPVLDMGRLGPGDGEAAVAPVERAHGDVAEAEGLAGEPVVAGEVGIGDGKRGAGLTLALGAGLGVLLLYVSWARRCV